MNAMFSEESRTLALERAKSAALDAGSPAANAAFDVARDAAVADFTDDPDMPTCWKKMIEGLISVLAEDVRKEMSKAAVKVRLRPHRAPCSRVGIA